MKLTINALVAFVAMITVTTTQVHAATASAASAIQQLNFALTVETGPKDTAARTAAINTFVAQIADMQKNGVPASDIVAAVKAQMPDAQTSKDIDTLAETAKQNKLSPEATAALVADWATKGHTSAPSWSDGATVAVVTLGIIVLVAVVIASGGTVSVSTGYVYTSCYYTCYDYYGNAYCC